MPAEEYRTVRKDASKSVATSDTLADAGKAPPSSIASRDYPGERVKVPKIDDTADTSEEVTLPRKCGCKVEKCACQVDKGAPPTIQEPNGDIVKPPAPAAQAEPSAPGVTAPEAPVDDPANQQPNGQPAGSFDSLMLALVVPEQIAKSLAQPDGTPHHEMHVTLGFYGKVGKDVHPDQLDTITKCVAMSAEGYKPTKAHIGGVGRFNASGTSDGKDVLIAHVDSPGLHEIRDHLVDHVHKCASIASAAGSEVKANGPRPKTDHGYTPHITLKYMEQDSDMPIHKLPRQEFTFTHLLMAVGKKQMLFPLGERPAMAKTITFVSKADDEKRLVTGIVLQPEVVDAQGDIISKEVIEAAAYNFLARYNQKTQLGLQHEIMKPEGVELVESYIAPADYVLNNRVITAGTWMMTVRVKNDVLWTKIKTGQITGFSIGGVARVQRLSV